MTKTKIVTAKAVKPVSNLSEKDAVNINVKNLYTTTKQITQATDVAAKVGANLQLEYQKIACSAIKHIGEHKDVRIIRHVLDTLPEGMRKKSMSAFFDRFAPVKFGENETTGEAEVTYAADKQAKLVEALIFPWWKASVESTYVPFDLERELAKLIQRAETKLKRGVSAEKGDNVTPEQVTALSTIMLQLHNAAQAAA